jgi:hypothetical protein
MKLNSINVCKKDESALGGRCMMQMEEIVIVLQINMLAFPLCVHAVMWKDELPFPWHYIPPAIRAVYTTRSPATSRFA